MVEEPYNLHTIERTRDFRGRYHVLHGALSPLQGIGPDELRVRGLLDRVRGGGVEEVILATSPTVEGEATAVYLARILKPLAVRSPASRWAIPGGVRPRLGGRGDDGQGARGAPRVLRQPVKSGGVREAGKPNGQSRSCDRPGQLPRDDRRSLFQRSIRGRSPLFVLRGPAAALLVFSPAAAVVRSILGLIALSRAFFHPHLYGGGKGNSRRRARRQPAGVLRRACSGQRREFSPGDRRTRAWPSVTSGR